jgi:hypothetical protein
MLQLESCEAQVSPFSQTGHLCQWKPFEEMMANGNNLTITAVAVTEESGGVCKYQPQQLSFEVRRLFSFILFSALFISLSSYCTFL